MTSISNSETGNQKLETGDVVRLEKGVIGVVIPYTGNSTVLSLYFSTGTIADPPTDKNYTVIGNIKI